MFAEIQRYIVLCARIKLSQLTNSKHLKQHKSQNQQETVESGVFYTNIMLKSLSHNDLLITTAEV